MCRIYNPPGSLTTLKLNLERSNIRGFSSLKDVLDFQNSYSTSRQQIISSHINLIEQEKRRLDSEIKHLESTIEGLKIQSEKRRHEAVEKLKQKLTIASVFIPTSYFQRIIKYIRQWYYTLKIRHIEQDLNLELNKSAKILVDLSQGKNIRYQFLLSHYNDAVKQSSQAELVELDRKKKIIDDLSSYIYGALGEQKVVRALESLSDEYFLINDFSISFSKPLYYSQEHSYIKSIQIDHILVAPSGVFLIETKNWSEKSMESLSLRSPVDQIKRTSFTLFKLLNNEIENNHIRLEKHHWGDKRISIRNLIVLINTKPKEEFQYVKILGLNELKGYVAYFKPVFSNTETQIITEFLLSINEQKKLTAG